VDSVMDDMVGHPTPPRALRDSGVLLTAYKAPRSSPNYTSRRKLKPA